MKEVFQNGESTEFSGKIIVALAQDPNIIKYSSKTVISAEYAQAKNIRDVDGRVIYSIKQLKSIAQTFLPEKLKFIAYFIPAFVKIPQFLIDITFSKF